jgi:acyl-CoA dehydrogenase
MVFDTLVRIEHHLAQFIESAPNNQLSHVALGRSAAEVEASRLLAYRVLSEQLRGGDPSDVGSITKLYWSQAWVRFAEAALLTVGESAFNSGLGTPKEALLDNFLECRPGTIASGSSEIQRNIVAKRVLKLPTA